MILLRYWKALVGIIFLALVACHAKLDRKLAADLIAHDLGQEAIMREVTGIALSADGREADVEFQWSMSPLRYEKQMKAYKQFSGLIPNMTIPSTGKYKGRSKLRLYDDGWRVTTTALPLERAD